MTELIQVTASQPYYLHADAAERIKITNATNTTLYYKDAKTVSASNYDGKLTQNQKVTRSRGTYLRPAANCQVILESVAGSTSDRRLPAMEVAPQQPAAATANVTLVADRAFVVPYRPTADGVLTGLHVQFVTASGSDDSIDVGIYESTGSGGTLLASSGAWSGRANASVSGINIATGIYKQTLPVGPVEVKKDKEYFLALACGTIGGTAGVVAGITLGAANYFESSQAMGIPGYTGGLYQETAYPLPATLSQPFVNLTAPPYLAAHYKRRIIAFGDSTSITQDGFNSYPTKLQQRLGPYAYLMAGGVASNTTTQMIARIANDITRQKPHEVIVLAGVNDCGVISANQIITNLNIIYAAVKAAGGIPKTVCITPAGNKAGWGATPEASRATVNAWLRSSANPYDNADLDSTLGDAADQTVLAAAYDDGTGVHFTTAGSNVMAEALFQQLYGGRKTDRPA